MIFTVKSAILVQVLVFFAYFEYRHAEVYKLGAIFETENSRQEAAMYEAINGINNYYEYFKFEPLVKYITENNPFEAVTATCSLLEEEVVGILGPLSEDNSNVIQSICDLKEIPHIEVRWDDHPMSGTIVNVHPYPDTLTRTYYDIIMAWEWTDFVILYENNESLQRVGELIKMFEPLNHRIVVRQIDKKKTDGIYRTVLKEVWRSGATHFVLDCSLDILDEVLRQAQQVGLMTSKHHFIITNLDLHTIQLTQYQYSETNITGMRFVDPLDPSLIEKAANIYEVPPGREALAGLSLKLEEALTFDAVNMFAAAINATRSLITPTSISCYNSAQKLSSGTSIVNIMKDLEHPGLTGNVKFDIRGFRTDFSLDIFELMEGGQTVVGTWNSTRRPSLNIYRVYPEPPEDNMDIRNRTFRVMIALTEPYGMRVESSDPLYGNDQYEGFAVDLIKELAAMRGFNYTFVLRDDKKNGEYDNATGEWTGIIGDLIKGNADLAITDLTITMERASAVDFTEPFMMLGISILYKKPTKAPPSFFSFADPFAFEVWKLLMVAWVGVAVILFVLGRISPTEWENPYPCIEEPEFLVNQLDFRNCFWFVTGSIMQQGSEIELKSVSTRMIAGMWWFFTLLMVSSYTANLAAFLTTENPDPHFTNLKELVNNAEDKEIKYGAKDGGATAMFFRDKYREAPDSDFGKAWDHMMKYKNEVMVEENKDGVTKASKEKYAFFMEDQSIEYETQRKCDLNQVGNKLDEKGYGIAMRKNETYRHSLSTAILKLQNSGKISEIKRKWWEERKGGGQCYSDGESSEAQALNLNGVEGVFYVTIGGAIVAFCFAIIESFINMTKKSIRTKTPFGTVFKDEVKFYFRFGEMEKQVLYGDISSSTKSQSEEKVVPYGYVNKQSSVETLASSNRSKRSRSRRSRSRRSRSKKFDQQIGFNTC